MPEIEKHFFHTYACNGCGHTFVAPVSCGNRFCPTCHVARRRRLRGQLRAICDSLPAAKTFPVRFLTLTIPVGPELRNAARVLISSFRRLRQRKWWKHRVCGGCYVLEVAGRPGAWHIHLHIIVEGTFLPKRQLSAEWSKVGPGHIVRIRAFPPAVVASYITKYVTKSDLPPTTQLAASDPLRHLRLHSFFGNWLQIARSVKLPPATCPVCGYDCWVWLENPKYKGINNDRTFITWDDSVHLRNTG